MKSHAVYFRSSDSLWCAACDLPRDPSGQRRRLVKCSKSKATAITKLASARQKIREGDSK